ncbi:two-component sensor histidine kinase [Saccharophagus sp. K07]|jgi:two-component system sensor histidine kinase PhoQ|uniref:ATP-binding protein n=1 Tax=Saccharophagus sp. K07 TaxID=2283636 RepID=UPI0016525475|nr:ATP-binding protein [Saccharophagus sp. K07]MBC6904439.1 two-component sensor histidine kinase [Saccharophagus sp. K07]
MLNHAYQRSLRTAERDALSGQIYILLGAAEPSEKGLKLPTELSEPRYSAVNSGLMGWVVNSQGALQWRSLSSELIAPESLPTPTTNFSPGRMQFFSTLIDGREYYAVSYDTVWDINNKEHGYRFVAMHSREPMINELEAYQKRLWKWLGGMALLLALVQTLIAKWGLSPLRKLAADLKRVEEGLEQLPGTYPAEIQPVTDNLNSVLRSERAQRERYRNTLSDLAHSLKTPLAVIRGHLENNQNLSPEALAQIVDEQVSRMSTIVDHQLRRASAQVTQASHSSTVPVKPLIERLVRALQKVYQTKGVQFSQKIPDNLHFHGDEADLMELLGNLIDNACKYGRHSVAISAQQQGRELAVIVEDDGPGVNAEVQQTILTRGTRADTATPGQGIGLAVAVDILSSYGGSIDIFRSKLGGAGFAIRIPN